tara:strand:+ start:5362 stop:6444 length:1083 start_codon:yes stop_codon:yes gene_type:complete
MSKNNYFGGNLIFEKDLFFKKNKYYFSSKYFYYSNSRSSIYNILKKIKKNNDQNILIPSYLCNDIFIKIFKRVKLKFKLYEVDSELNCNFSEIKNKIDKNTTAVIVVNYFGVNKNLKSLKEIKLMHKKLYTIYDTVHNPFYFFDTKNISKYIDFSFTSLKKNFPLPDGSILYSKNYYFNTLSEYSSDHVKLWHKASNYKKKFLKGNKSLILEKKYMSIYSKLNTKEKINNSSISKFSFQYTNKIKINVISSKKILNYNYMYEKLKNIKNIHIFNLKKDHIPMFFPIFFKSEKYRDKIYYSLLENNIFCPKHWALNKDFSKLLNLSQKKFYNCQLSIPIDYRLNKHDILKIYKYIFELTNA